MAFMARWTGWTLDYMMSLSPFQFEQILVGLVRVHRQESGEQDPDVKEALQEQINRESERKVREGLKGRKGGKVSMKELLAMDPSPEIRRH